MKRNCEEQVTSLTRKKLKFGVDTILGKNEDISSDENPISTDLSIHFNDPLHSFWQPNFRPVFGANEFYFPPPMSNFLWSFDHSTKMRPRMLRRAVFSDQQRKDLEAVFQKQKYINKPERKKLAQRLGLKESQVDSKLNIN